MRNSSKSVFFFYFPYSIHPNLRSGVLTFFFRGGKERLIQLLDYSSAAPLLKYLSARMSLRGQELRTQGTDSVNLHAVLYSGLFCKTRPPVSFVMSKFQKQNLVKVPFTL